MVKAAMPALHNQKHENFCLLTVRGAAQGLNQSQIYQMAGYTCDERVAAANASRLLKNANIRARIAELTAPAAKKAAITIETLLTKLEANIIGAEAKGQHGAVNGSISLMAQLRGLLINRTEIGEVGAFDQATTIADVARLLLQDQSAAEALATLAALCDEIERIGGDRAELVPAPEPARARPDEAALSLNYLRPKHRRL